MLINQELLAEYDYLDELDCRGWAWEFLRRRDDYRADYDRLQTLEHPEPFNSKHEPLAEKWHVQRLLDPDSREVPKFFYPRWQDISIDPTVLHPREWEALMIEKRPPEFNSQTWKRSIICKNLKDQGCSINEIARRLYPGHEGRSTDPRHHPARHLVQGDRKRLERLQADYLKIAFSNT